MDPSNRVLPYHISFYCTLYHMKKLFSPCPLFCMPPICQTTSAKLEKQAADQLDIHHIIPSFPQKNECQRGLKLFAVVYAKGKKAREIE